MAADVIVVRAIVGHRAEPRFATRTLEALPVSSRDAERRRLHGVTSAGTEVRIDLAVGAFLRHGAVLADDGSRAIVVERVPEDVVVVRLDPGAPAGDLVAAAFAIGHALGNQHVPMEVQGTQIHVPITTSPQLALDTLRAIAPAPASVSIEAVRLAADRPVWSPRRPGGHAHDHGGASA